jgi:hypothetical protein
LVAPERVHDGAALGRRDHAGRIILAVVPPLYMALRVTLIGFA